MTLSSARRLAERLFPMKNPSSPTVGGLYFAQSEALVYISLATVGIGFGMGYISVPVVFSSFFGRRAFATTTGTRMLISGTFNAFAPIGAGMIFDLTGSYDIAFFICVGLTLVGAVVVFMAKPPGLAPPEAAAGA